MQLIRLSALAALSSYGCATNIIHNGLGSTPAQRHVVSVQQAIDITNAAVDKATNLSIVETIAILNPSGGIVTVLSMDNAWPATVDIAIKKARTTALTNGLPSSALLAGAQGPDIGVEETNGGLVVFAGGLPLYHKGYFIGAVGCSGAVESSMDVTICNAGLAALAA